MCLCGNITITLNQVPADCNNCFQFLSWPLSSLQFKLSDANWERVDLDVIELINYLEYKKKSKKSPWRILVLLGPSLGPLPSPGLNTWLPTLPSFPCHAVQMMGWEGQSLAGMILRHGSASKELPSSQGLGQGDGLGTKVWGLHNPPPPSYGFWRGMASCTPQVRVGLVPQHSLETPQHKAR